MIGRMGPKYASILRLCGVTSINALANQNSSILAQNIKEKNEILKRSYKQYLIYLPSEKKVSGWVDEAKKMII